MTTAAGDAKHRDDTAPPADDTDRAHAEEPAEGDTAGDSAADVPREHSEDPAEG